jgi:hypothetical protein
MDCLGPEQEENPDYFLDFFLILIYMRLIFMNLMRLILIAFDQSLDLHSDSVRSNLNSVRSNRDCASDNSYCASDNDY